MLLFFMTLVLIPFDVFGAPQFSNSTCAGPKSATFPRRATVELVSAEKGISSFHCYFFAFTKGFLMPCVLRSLLNIPWKTRESKVFMIINVQCSFDVRNSHFGHKKVHKNLIGETPVRGMNQNNPIFYNQHQALFKAFDNLVSVTKYWWSSSRQEWTLKEYFFVKISPKNF